MGKLNQLLGVANNLGASFISILNIDFLHYIEKLEPEKTKSFEKRVYLKEPIPPGNKVS